MITAISAGIKKAPVKMINRKILKPVTSLNTYTYYNPAFKSQKDNYQQIAEKRNYLNAETQNIRNLGEAALITSLFCDAHHVNFSQKNSGTQKFGVAMLLLSIGSFLYEGIKQHTLGK